MAEGGQLVTVAYNGVKQNTQGVTGRAKDIGNTF